jgi:copper(I)-binding protein
MRVHNSGPQDDRLLEASCPCAATVEIVGTVVVAPEQEVLLAPGGTPGLRLRGLTDPLRRGRFVSVTLTFEHAGPVTAEVEVRPAA